VLDLGSRFEGLLSLGKSLRTFFEHDREDRWIGALVGGLELFFNAVAKGIVNIWNKIKDAFGLPTDKPGNGFKFLSDAEYGVSFSESSSSSSSPPATTPVLQGMGSLKAVDQVNLLCWLYTRNIAIAKETSSACDNASWFITNTLTGEVARLPSKKDTTTGLYTTVEAKQEGSYKVEAYGEKNGKHVPGYWGEVPVIMTTLLEDVSNDPQKIGGFFGVPTAEKGYAYQNPSDINSSKTRIPQTELKHPSYNNQTVYMNWAYSEINYKGTKYYMIHTGNSANEFMYVKQEEFSKVIWPVNSHSPTDYWGWRTKPSTINLPLSQKIIEFHYGVDVGGGGDVRAIMDGKLTYAQDTGARGYTIILEHTIAGFGTFYTLYQHLSSTDFPTSTDVANKKAYKAGVKIANMGGSGANGQATYNTHLHYELMKTRSSPYSLYSINPLGTYADRDTRNDARPISSYNPDPFFVNVSSYGFLFNPYFDWEFYEPVPKQAQPVIFSHYSSYGNIYPENKVNPQTINSGEG